MTKATWPKTVDTVVEKSEAGSKVSVLYTPTYGDQVVTTAGIKSLNPEIAVVDVATGVVTPIKEGTATIVVKVGDVSAEYALTVVGDPKETSLKLNADKSKTTTSLTVNNAGAKTNAKLVVDVLDQNGNPKNGVNTVSFKLTAGDGVVSAGGAALTTGSAAQTVSAGNDFVLEPLTTGTAYFEVSSGSLAKIYVAVTVNAADQTFAKYIFAGLPASLDLNGDYSDPKGVTSASITLTAANASGEAISAGTAETVSGATISIKNADGTEVAKKVTSGSDQTIAIDINNTITSGAKAFTEGTYTITATKNGYTYGTATFTVVDTATKPTVNVLAISAKDGGSGLALTTLFGVPTGCTVASVKFVSDNSTVVASRTTATAAAITASATGSANLTGIVVTVNNGSRSFDVSVPQTITISK